MELPPIFLAHLVATLAMGGLIWFVQLVHYPLFDAVAQEGFTDFERRHQRRTSWVVIPLMLVELVTGVMLALSPPDPAWGAKLRLGLGLLIIIWLVTMTVSAPLHKRLEAGWSRSAYVLLVRTNGIRTALWTLRCGVLVALLLP